MIRFLSKPHSSELAIDLGTANTLIYERGRGIVLDEPSVVACRLENGYPSNGPTLAYGSIAKLMLGRTPSSVTAVRPVREGVISDFNFASKMLRRFLEEIASDSYFKFRPRVVACVPTGSTKVERRAIREVLQAAGARRVHVIDKVLAAAIGADQPVLEANGSVVLDVGAGTSEIGVCSLGGLVCSNSIRVGGDTLDEMIMAQISRTRGMTIGPNTAETIKKEIANPYLEIDHREIEVAGIDKKEGRPRTFSISGEEIAGALHEPIGRIVDMVKKVLERTPPELSEDIADRGIILTGGGALLKNLDRIIQNEIGIRIVIADDPLGCTARGAGKILESNCRLKDLILEYG